MQQAGYEPVILVEWLCNVFTVNQLPMNGEPVLRRQDTQDDALLCSNYF